MAIIKTVINVLKAKLTMKVLNKVVEYKIFESLSYMVGSHDCYTVDVMDFIEEAFKMVSVLTKSR